MSEISYVGYNESVAHQPLVNYSRLPLRNIARGGSNLRGVNVKPFWVTGLQIEKDLLELAQVILH